MPDLTLVILSAGSSSRFGVEPKKQWIRVGSDPLWSFVAQRFIEFFNFKEIIITASKDELNYMRKYANYTFVVGGESRQESLRNAILHVKTPYVLVTDVARACVDKDLVLEIILHFNRADIVVPYLNVDDTVVYKGETIQRDDVKLIQTPQLSNTTILKKALDQKEIFTDDSTAIRSIGGKVLYIKGRVSSKKITRYDDLRELECLSGVSTDKFVGIGFDVHQFCKDKTMYLCGTEIKSSLGFKAHSDGDVAIHALIDSLLGAVGAGDIGELFPDSDDRYKNIDSKLMLKDVVKFIKGVGYEISNVDITIIAQTPKLSPYKEEMRRVLSDILGCKPIFVNIKATTTEKLGFVGREEGVAVEAVSSLKYFNWK